MEIKIMKNILHSNNKIAQENRDFLQNRGMVALNILASPGAGKTSLVLKIIEGLRSLMPIAVIEGDIEGSIDAEIIENQGIPVIQINTGGGCHLDSNMFREALTTLDLPDGCLILIENVGNLVCPAAFDIGESGRLVVASITEGNDKPIKYPMAFQSADVIVVNKIDLIEHTNFNRESFYKGLSSVSQAPVFEVACTTSEGIEEFIEWLKDFYSDKRGRNE